MPLDFPANPINGQVYDSYVYNSTVGAWQAREDSATVAITSPTAPVTANNGDIWYNSNTGVSYVYYADGSSAQWVEIVSSALPILSTKADLTYVDSQDALKANIASPTFTGTVTAPRFTSTQATGTAPFSVSSTTVVTNLNADLLDGQHASVYSPAGMVSQFAGATAPTGWLLCDGTAVSRTTYSTLFSTIGTTYGTGDGSTTFNLPNLKGKVPVGRDSADTNFDNLNTPTVYAGAKVVALSEANVPSHTHTFSGTTGNGGAHSHQIDVSGTQLRYLNTNAAASTGLGGLAGIAGGTDNLRATGVGDHTHPFSGTTSTGSGSGTAHNNLQPYIVMNYIIKT